MTECFCVCYLHMQVQTLCRAVEISITTSYSATDKIFYRGLFCDLAHEGQVERILGDPGAVRA